MKRSTKLILGIILTIVLVFPIFKMQSSAVENNEGKSEVKQNGNQQTEQLLQSDLEETTKFVQTLTCNKTGLREGEDITIDINISGSQHTASEFEGYLNYDKEVLSYKDGVANNGWSLLLFDSLESDEEAEGVIEISRENSDEVLAEGSIVSLTFTVLKDTEDTIVKLYDSWMADTNNISYSEDTQITLLSKANDGGDDDDDDIEE